MCKLEEVLESCRESDYSTYLALQSPNVDEVCGRTMDGMIYTMHHSPLYNGPNDFAERYHKWISQKIRSQYM